MKWYWKLEGKKYFEYSVLPWGVNMLEGDGPSLQNTARKHILQKIKTSHRFHGSLQVHCVPQFKHFWVRGIQNNPMQR